MKGKTFLIFATIVLLSFIMFSCGLRIPSKAPEKVNVKYTKHLEFPITTFSASIYELISDFEASLTDFGFKLNKTEGQPLEIEFATDLTISPKTFLEEIEDQIEDALSNLQDISFNISTNFIQTQLSGSVSFPTLNPIQIELSNYTEFPINPISLVNNQQVPVLQGENSISITNLLSGLPFDSANFTSIKFNFVVQGSPQITSAKVIIDNKPYDVNTIHQDVNISKSSQVFIKFNSNSAGTVNITLSFEDLKLNAVTSLNVSQVKNDGKIVFDIPQQKIDVDPGNWKLSLDGNIGVNLSIPGFAGNIHQYITIKATDTNVKTIGLGTSANTNCTVNLDSNEVFNVSEGIVVSGTVELSGNVSIDLRNQKIKVNVTPNVQPKKIQNFPITTSVPLPGVVQSLQFSQGTLKVKFIGFDLESVSGTFGSNSVSLEDKEIKIDLSNVSLPATLTANISGEVTANQVSFETGSLSNDTTIGSAVIDANQFNLQAINVNYPIPTTLSSVVSSLFADIAIDFGYLLKGISGVQLEVQSNFFNNNTYNLTQEGTITIAASNTIDFSGFTEFQVKIEPKFSSSTITLTNVNLADGIAVSFKPKLSKFEIDNMNLVAGQSYEFDQIDIIDFNNVISENLSFLKDLDYDFNVSTSFLATNTTLQGSLELNISSTPVTIQIGQTENIGNIIEDLFKTEGNLWIKPELVINGGTLKKDTEITIKLEAKLPLSATATQNVQILDGTIDLSDISEFTNYIKTAKLEFKEWNNNTGLTMKLKLGNKEINIGTQKPTISLTKAELESIATNTQYEISIPANTQISFNYPGTINVAPYIVLDLNAAVEVPLKGE